MTLHDEIERLYAALPAIKCQRKCQPACGPITMSQVEADRIVEHVGEHPPGLALESSGALCPALSVMGNCMIYAVRPAICRLYGLIRALPCAWGCIPERWVSNEEGHALIRRLEALGEPGRFPLPIDGAPEITLSELDRELGLLAVLVTQREAADGLGA